MIWVLQIARPVDGLVRLFEAYVGENPEEPPGAGRPANLQIVLTWEYTRRKTS